MANSDNWTVQFAGSALEDLIGIIQYLLENEGLETAQELGLLIRNEGNNRLKLFPYRGKVVQELETITKEYREIRVKSYRLVYRVISDRQLVRILMVAHVRRRIQDMLLSRLLSFE